ncbi:glycosyltransferase family 2 protein [Motilimonas eburnea]|uniref:glycosyltransferase family 2 protein n=1 Tax=Motilimonas eburnea TaxID=1737488 RepID=UPI001E653874|nr:glycosyltransferase family 2 protein [Motilimonas eburnea]MCE2570754.1 glycosyltransferase family 2 protein [Motilimonas eburnea]
MQSTQVYLLITDWLGVIEADLNQGPLAWFTLICITLVIYHHVAYPLLLKWIASRKMEPATPSVTISSWPDITILMPVFNEAKYIESKIYNLGTLDYPNTKLKIVIGFDGCSDDSVQRAQHALAMPENSHLNCQLVINPHNQGKVGLINQLMQGVTATTAAADTWVALTDVSALISFDALTLAAQHIANSSHQVNQHKPVGVICSHYQMLQPGSEGEATYWRYQSNIKRQEATFGATLGAHGALYLFRHDLFSPLANDTINDDFILPMQIVAKGYRCLYEPNMNAVELEQASQQMDSLRRKRIAAGNTQQLVRLRSLLLGKAGLGVAFTFLSGKALRVLMPFLMLASLILSAWLSYQSWIFASLCLIQLSLYTLALLAPLLDPHCPKIIRTINYLVLGHCANLVGSTRYLCGLEQHRWQKIEK